MRRVLGFRLHAGPRDTAPPPIGFRRQLHDFIEGGDGESSVKGTDPRSQFRQTLSCTQGLDLGEGEIFREPARHGLAVDDLGTAALRELRVLRDVGGSPDLILVPRDEHAVPSHHQVGLYVVGALLDRQPIGLDRMLRPLAAGSAVSNDKDIRQGTPDRSWPSSLPHARQHEAPLSRSLELGVPSELSRGRQNRNSRLMGRHQSIRAGNPGRPLFRHTLTPICAQRCRLSRKRDPDGEHRCRRHRHPSTIHTSTLLSTRSDGAERPAGSPLPPYPTPPPAPNPSPPSSPPPPPPHPTPSPPP